MRWLAVALFIAVFSGCVADEPDVLPDPLLSEIAEQEPGENVTPLPPNTAPVANLTANVTSGNGPLNVTFIVAGFDADGDNLTWAILFGDEPPATNATTGNGTDDGNATQDGNATSPDNATSDGNVTSDGNATSDGNGTSDGNLTTDLGPTFTNASLPASVNHTYVEPGNYTATLFLSDGRNTTNVTVVIQVFAAPVPPPAEPVEGEWATFNVDGTCDAKGEISVPGGLYVHERGDPPGTGYLLGSGTWIYEESNGIAGLQLGGALEEAIYVDCVNPDILIF